MSSKDCFNFKEVKKKIDEKLEKVTNVEVIAGPDDVPIAVNILKLLELYEQGNFYGVIGIKIVGASPRNLKVLERSYKLKEEKSELFLDKLST